MSNNASAVANIPRRPATNVFANAQPSTSPFLWLSSLLAQFGVFLVGTDYYFMMGGSLGLLWLVLLAPVCLSALRRYTAARFLAAAVPLTLGWGWVLAFQTSTSHRVDVQHVQVFTGVVLSGLAAFILILWARTFTTINRVALLFGLGGLAKAVIRSDFTWKFGLSLPVTFIVLGLVGRLKSRLLQASVLLGLGILGIATGARSYFSFALLSALMYLWQRPLAGDHPRAVTGGLRRWLPALLMGAIGIAIYFSVSYLLTSGAFGTFLQQRSVSQIETSGSLIAGGRPEWAATRELMKQRPHGFGIGVVPTWSDLRAGKSGLASINVDAGGYTKNYMFGGSFELHSVFSDLWVSCGIAGLALSVILLFYLVRNLSTLLASRSAPLIVLFLSNVALWSMLFGPLYTDWLLVCAALGLSMVLKHPHEDALMLDGST